MRSRSANPVKPGKTDKDILIHVCVLVATTYALGYSVGCLTGREQYPGAYRISGKPESLCAHLLYRPFTIHSKHEDRQEEHF